MADGLDLVPSTKREAVRAALAQSFGARPVAGLKLLQGGVSGALIWHVDMGERSCVLRVEPERIPFDHRQRGFACMVAAATACIAPAVYHADPAAGIAIMDYVDGRPLSEHPGGTAGLVQELGGLITRLQRTPAFASLGEPGDDIIANVLATLDGSGLFADGLLNAHKEGLARIRATSPWNPSLLVSSHNDPNPRNMIFDGDRIWLVDWELASCNDPLFDLAILTFDLAVTSELTNILCVAAGTPPNRALIARLTITRLLARLFYGCIALEAFAGLPRTAPEDRIGGLTPAEFHSAVREGRLQRGGSDLAWAFGKMSLAAFTRGMSEPTINDTLELAREAADL